MRVEDDEFIGPWLLLALVKKNIGTKPLQKQIVFDVIDAFNDMLAKIAAANPAFHYVDLRPVIQPNSDWVNELHLTNSAFSKASELIHQKIQQVIAN